MLHRRRCDSCRGFLHGKRGHGFVSENGKTIKCRSCEFPPRKRRWRKKKKV